MAKQTFEQWANEWASKQPHIRHPPGAPRFQTFFSHWPIASRTKCDFCGVYYPDHQPAPAEEDDVAKHPTKAIKVPA